MKRGIVTGAGPGCGPRRGKISDNESPRPQDRMHWISPFSHRYEPVGAVSGAYSSREMPSPSSMRPTLWPPGTVGDIGPPAIRQRQAGGSEIAFWLCGPTESQYMLGRRVRAESIFF